MHKELREAYEKAKANGEVLFTFEGCQYAIIHEGLADRLKARAAGVAGSVKGAAKRLSGAALVAKGSLSGDKDTIGRGNAMIRKGSVEGTLAKVASIKKSALARLDEVLVDIVSDIRALNIDWKNSPDDLKPADMLKDLFVSTKRSTTEIFNEIEDEIRQ